MEQYAVWQGNKTFLVYASSAVRAIQAAMLELDYHVASDNWNAAPMAMYSDKVQAKILCNSISI